ncbi:MFS transporter, partial [Nocardia salmonicida]
MTEVNAAETVGEAAGRGQVLAWGLWDWGSSAFQAVTLTFVFSVYLTDKVGKDLPGTTPASAWLGWALAGAGLVVALTAPVCGQYFDAVGSRKRALATLTALTVGAMSLMFFVRDDYNDLWLGLALLAFASATFELAGVPYNAMMRQVSTPATV